MLVGSSWVSLSENASITAGARIRTGPNTTMDLVFLDSGTALRVLPDSELRFDSLGEMPGADRAVTTTRLSLLSGGVIGSQRKLVATSEFLI